MRIVALDGRTLNPGDNPWSPIEMLGDLSVYDNSTPTEAQNRLKGANIAIINKVPLTGELLDTLEDLRFIAVTATGVNIVDLEAAKRNKILVSNVPSYSSNTVAQFVFAQILNWCHRLDHHDQAIRSGNWSAKGDFSFWETPQIELSGRTIGIIGLGKIGSRVAQIAQAFGMNVLTTKRSKPTNLTQGIAYVELEQLLAESDFVTLHCPLTQENPQMVNAGFLRRMKRTAYFINTARGGLVCEAELAAALEQSIIAGAALDVVSQEPIEDANPLLRAPNCLLTPHMAWATLASRQRLMQTTAENIAAFIAGSPKNLVKPKS